MTDSSLTISGVPDAGSLVDWAERRFATAGIVCAQGTANVRDEAAFLVFHALRLSHDDPAAYAQPVPVADLERVIALVEDRVRSRRPAAYLLGEAWFAGLTFEVSEDVLIPRSPFAELIAGRFAPWITLPERPRILEIGTGSGCIAIACAVAFPAATVLATDISPAALEVARRNVQRHRVAERVTLQRADLLDGVSGEFDLIISNPPYVPDGELADAAPEFGWEPRLALAGGPDGLALVRRILQDSPHHLGPDGWLAVEVGGGGPFLERVFPDVPFIWPELAQGGDGIALVSRRDLVQRPADGGSAS